MDIIFNKKKKKNKSKNLSALLDIISSKDAVRAMYKIMSLKDQIILLYHQINYYLFQKL